jgi:acetate---CoA ligase (ADP-forming)
MLDALFKPRAIAIIGASNNPYSIGNIVIRNLLEYKFHGPIFPINPKGGHIQCLKAYKSILEVPDEIDLVNISVQYKHIPKVIEDCGKKGVKFAIVHSAGFKEVGEEGIRREREMVELANSFGMRVFGPNSQGVQNADPEVSAYANFTFVPMKPGNVSIVAQGGGMGELLKLHLHRVGLGHRMYASYGNECDLTMPEILEYYGQDEGTRAIMMQIESFKNPKKFLEVASRITPHKPILAIKAGRTKEGSVAVSSHTGTLVDQAAMAKALFKKAGVVDFVDSDEMIKTAIAMSMQPIPKGKRIGIITNTGGPGIQAVDTSVDSGLELAKWSDAGRERLAASLYAEASLGNPVDVVATAGPDHFHAAVDTLLHEDGVDMAMVYFVTAPFVDLPAIATRIKEATTDADKPVVCVVCTIDKWAGLVNQLRESGIPVYDFAEDAARSLAGMARYHALKSRAAGELQSDLALNRDAAAKVVERYAGKNAYMTQVDAFELLSCYGIGVPRRAAIGGKDDLAKAAETVGFPCVLKVDSASVVHKSEAGGVVLNIADARGLGAAFEEMRGKFGAEASFVLLEQKPAGREVIIGATEAPGLGSLVMFGLGGVFVEVMKDVVFSVAPLTDLEADEMISGIRASAVLEGVRGQAGVDQGAIRDLLVRVSRLVADFPNLVEMDLNPVLAYPAGQAPAAVDVRIRVR